MFNRRQLLSTCVFGPIALLFASKQTPEVSGWHELSRAEIIMNRTNELGLKGKQLMSDYDILTKWLKYTDEQAKAVITTRKT